MFCITSATKKIAALKKRIRAVQGGTSAGKTIAILSVLIDAAQRDKTPTITSVVSESFPHLRRGAMKDFLSIMEQQSYFVPDNWSKTDFTYTFETGSKIEFFSADQPDKVRGPRRERLFLNECNNVPYETFDQLEIRTSQYIFLDWNPTADFWFYDHVKSRDDVEFLIVNYKDNEGLSPEIVKSIEQRRGNAQWWKVYGEGQLGEAEGRIFTGWQTIDSVPHEARLERYGLDFGYTNDPSSIIAVYYYNGGYLLDEIAYTKGLSNKQIADILLNQPKKALTIADSAEPKSIDEIRSYGINIMPTTKGPGSVLQRIQLAQDQQISITKRSTNLLKEYRNYQWLKDREGRIINEPDHLWSHGMDAFMYALSSVVPLKRRQEFIDSLPRYAPREQPNPAL